MYRRAVNYLSLFSQCQMVGYRNGFVMGYQKTMIRPAEGCPAAHAGRSAGAAEIDGGITSESMMRPIHWPMTFMTAPSQFRWLKTFPDKTIHRPGIDKLIGLFALGSNLGITLCNVDCSYVEPMRKLRPFAGVCRFFHCHAGVSSNVQ